MTLSAITGKTVRDWYAATRRQLATAARKRGGMGETRLRQSYSLLRAILSTAAADELIAENPCRIVGAGTVSNAEGPYLSPEQIAVISKAMPDVYDIPLRVMLGAHLRLGELVALQRGDFDAERRSLRVERQTLVVDSHEVTTGTKTGLSRNVALPPSVAIALADHLAVGAGFARSPMFGRPDGQPLSRFQMQRAWAKAARAVGLGQFHLHDERHAGLTLAAQAGATTRELMARGGHSTSRAALIYQHVAEERLAGIADRLDTLMTVPLLAPTPAEGAAATRMLVVPEGKRPT